MHFEKVPFEEYARAYEQLGLIPADADSTFMNWLKIEWEGIILPTRATKGSAGYDFHLPTQVNISPTPVVIPTGIRACIDPGWFLMILPRSGLGFKYGMRFQNTAGVIDEDYFTADNYGHIMAKVKADKELLLQAGDRFMQGIFLPYGTIESDRPSASTRTGGFGSTGV